MMNDFENWLDEIRIELNEKTKNMNKQEIVNSTNITGRRVAEKYGIPVVKSASCKSTANLKVM